MHAILALFLAGGVVTEMTPDLIREAIAYGAKEKKLKPYKLGGMSITQNRPGAVAHFTTPFLRVALASSEAKSTYKEFAEKDVTPDLIGPEVTIIAHAFVPTGSKDPDSVKAVVAFLADGKPLQPDRTDDLNEEFSDAQGKEVERSWAARPFPALGASSRHRDPRRDGVPPRAQGQVRSGEGPLRLRGPA